MPTTDVRMVLTHRPFGNMGIRRIRNMLSAVALCIPSSAIWRHRCLTSRMGTCIVFVACRAKSIAKSFFPTFSGSSFCPIAQRIISALSVGAVRHWWCHCKSLEPKNVFRQGEAPSMWDKSATTPKLNNWFEYSTLLRTGKLQPRRTTELRRVNAFDDPSKQIW